MFIGGNKMEYFNVQPPQYDRYDYMSRSASAGGSIDILIMKLMTE